MDIICSALESGFDFIMIQVQFIFLAVPGPDITYFESGPDFIMSVMSGFYHVSPGPNFIHFESGADFIMLVRVRILSILSTDPDSDFVKEVWVAGPVPDFIHF